MNIFCKKILVLNVSLLLLLSASFTQKVSAQDYDDNAQDQPISMQTFYDDLSPYGQWIEDQQYGYVWVPNVDATFRPYYTSGHWVMTEYGNTWVSDYPWGWAAFHYGRWTYDDYYGWIWIPGTTWGPAWVSWRQSDSYCGWAPLGPGITASMSWGGGYYCPDTWWTFLPPQYLYKHHYYHYWYGTDNNTTIIRNTTVINNTYVNNNSHTTYISGPRASEIERITNQPVTVYHLSSASGVKKSTEGNGTVTMYHPMHVSKTTEYGAKPQPAILANTAQPITHTPQSPMTGGAAPAFHQQQMPERTDANTVAAPARSAASQPEQQRYEYNPQRAQPQTIASPDRQQAQNMQREPQAQAPAQNFSRPQQPAPQNFQRSQPVTAPPMSRPAAPAMQAPRVQAPAAPRSAEPAGRR